MKIAISHPPLPSEKGVALLSQNRQFQWFNNPTFIYPMVPRPPRRYCNRWGMMSFGTMRSLNRST